MHTALLSLTLAASVVIAGSGGRIVSRPLDELLERAATYVQDYHRRLTTIVAEEHYVQRSTGPLRTADDEERTLRSDFMLLPGSPGEGAWLAFRDVFEVNGEAVSSQRGRLEEWLTGPRSTFLQRARALALEQSRYNLGPILRTINVPTLALEILEPENQKRFRFRAAGAANIAGVPVSVVSFEERRRPTMIRTPEGRDIPARGTLWIEPGSGQVMKTELRTGEAKPGQVDATISVAYAHVARLDLLLPEVMQERYVAGGADISCTASYSNFRRFETDARIIR